MLNFYRNVILTSLPSFSFFKIDSIGAEIFPFSSMFCPMTKLTVGRPLAVQHLDKLFNPYLKKIETNLEGDSQNLLLG